MALYSIRKNAIITKMSRVNSDKANLTQQKQAWTILRENVQTSKISKVNKGKAFEFQTFNLKLKAWT